MPEATRIVGFEFSGTVETVQTVDDRPTGAYTGPEPNTGPSERMPGKSRRADEKRLDAKAAESLNMRSREFASQIESDISERLPRVSTVTADIRFVAGKSIGIEGMVVVSLVAPAAMRVGQKVWESLEQALADQIVHVVQIVVQKVVHGIFYAEFSTLLVNPARPPTVRVEPLASAVTAASATAALSGTPVLGDRVLRFLPWVGWILISLGLCVFAILAGVALFRAAGSDPPVPVQQTPITSDLKNGSA